MKTEKKRSFFIVMWCVVLVLLSFTIMSMGYFMKQMSSAQILEESFQDFEDHYAFITDKDDTFLQSVYEEAAKQGAEQGIYVENMGQNLAVNYSKEDLMKIAIYSKVKGIIVEADESSEMIELIDKSVNEGIPVVTVGADSTGSLRQSYVSISYYNLGQKYGEEIGRAVGWNKVVVLMKQDLESSNQNIIFSGIKDALDKKSSKKNKFVVEAQGISDSSSFGTQEIIRDILLDEQKRPDILVCLDETSTNCARLAVIDYNLVGQVKIYGYSDAKDILDAIEKDIVQATAVVGTEQMGAYCVEALTEYRNTGYVNEYMPVDVTIITASNIKEYRPDEIPTEE